MKKRILISVFNALLMAMFISLFMAIINVGFTDILLLSWLKGWLIGSLIALPLSFFLPPLIAKTVDKLLK